MFEFVGVVCLWSSEVRMITCRIQWWVTGVGSELGWADWWAVLLALLTLCLSVGLCLCLSERESLRVSELYTPFLRSLRVQHCVPVLHFSKQTPGKTTAGLIFGLKEKFQQIGFKKSNHKCQTNGDNTFFLFFFIQPFSFYKLTWAAIVWVFWGFEGSAHVELRCVDQMSTMANTHTHTAAGGPDPIGEPDPLIWEGALPPPSDTSFQSTFHWGSGTLWCTWLIHQRGRCWAGRQEGAAIPTETHRLPPDMLV